MEFFILPIISSTNDVIMASNYVIVSIMLCLDGGHGNVMSSFGGCTTSGFDVIEGGSRRPCPIARCKKRPGMIGLTDLITG